MLANVAFSCNLRHYYWGQALQYLERGVQVRAKKKAGGQVVCNATMLRHVIYSHMRWY